MKDSIDFDAVGRRLKKLRIEHGLTQSQMADLTGCDITHVSNIENCHTKVSLPLLVRMCSVLHTPVDYILQETYSDEEGAVDRAILLELKGCSPQIKETAYQIIKVLKNQSG